jgi:xanthine dehydrogenase accessory factor
MTAWLQTVADKAARHGAAVRISIVRVEGSVPREAGAAMIVTEDETEGTIGGGALELDAVSRARSILRDARLEASAPWGRETRDYPLGPALGQCCGGYAKALFELFTRAEAAALQMATPHPAPDGRHPLPRKLALASLPLKDAISASGYGGERVIRALSLPSAGEGQGEGGITAASLAVRPLEPGVPIRILSHRKDGYAGLPLQVIRVTRDMLSGARPSAAVFLPASKRGPAWFIEPLEGKKTPLFLYGAGHVGRALVHVLSGLPFDVTWIDTGEDRFPQGIRERAGLALVVAKDPAAIARTAPAGAFHLVMTYSHPLDLAICHEVIKSGTFAYLGLIGSATKRARFMKRLRELGHNESALGRLTCPIGIPNVTGKEPAIIAVSVAAQLLERAASVGRGAQMSHQERGVAP